MEKDLDMKLYKEYLNGEKEAFELLYTKYKTKIEYFVFNIVKDYQKAEDITQEVFVYILKNGINQEYSFKYYIFLIAKSRALNYINVKKRRDEINQTYIFNESERIDKDALEIITREETKKELLDAIEMLDEEYKNAIYLVKVEELSYKETAEILGQSVQNVKNLVHRGKRELKKVLTKKGFEQMNKTTKILAIMICIIVGLSGITYAATQIIKIINKNYNVTFNPSYQSTIDEGSSNNIWIGSFELAWQELARKVGENGKVELAEKVEIAEELNKSTFSKKMLSEEDYSINISENSLGGYDINTTLNKNLEFIHVFDNFSNDFKNYTFGKNQDSNENIKYFGINNGSSEMLNENVEVLFFNTGDDSTKSNDFAVILKTVQGDEIILYRTDEEKAFDEYYRDIQNKAKEYTGEKNFTEMDELLVPYININGIINYNELAGKSIKNTNMYINEAVQNVNFYLNESGCNLKSQVTMVIGVSSASNRYFEFTDTFVLFMKEEQANVPYLALRVENADILEKKDDTNKLQVFDYTAMHPEKVTLEDGEYKFYEDDNYEYYYPNQKTKYVQVFYKDSEPKIETAEEALKAGRISLDLLDEYGVKYIKKKK